MKVALLLSSVGVTQQQQRSHGSSIYIRGSKGFPQGKSGGEILPWEDSSKNSLC